MNKESVSLRSVFLSFFFLSIVIPTFLLYRHHAYKFNIHALGPWSASIFVTGLGIIASGKKLEREERYYFLLVTFSIFFWLWTLALGQLCAEGNPAIAKNWFRLGSIGPILIPTNIYAFSVHFLGLQRRRMLMCGNIIAFLFISLSLTTSYFLTGVHFYNPWGYFPAWQFGRTIPYFLYFVTFMGLAQYEYWNANQKEDNPRIRNQINYLFIAFSVSYVGAIDFLPTFGYRVYPIGYIAILGWWTVLAYAIFKHQLMDISIIIRRTIIYSVVTGTLTLLYLSVVSIFAKLFGDLTGKQTVFSSGIAACVITICFHPLRRRVQMVIDSKFFRQYVDREEKLYELSREVITHTNSEAMGNALMRVINETFHPKSSVLFLRSSSGAGYEKVSGINDKNLPQFLVEDHSFAVYFRDYPQPFLHDLTRDVGKSYSTRSKDGREELAS